MLTTAMRSPSPFLAIVLFMTLLPGSLQPEAMALQG